MPKIYIVVGSYYGGDRLQSFLKLVRSCTFPDFAIVMNEQRGDDTRQPSGFSRIYNPLVECALADKNCETVILCNDDILPTPGCLETIVDTLNADPTLGAVSPAMVWLDKGIPTTVEGLANGEYRYVPISEFKGGTEELVFAGFGCVAIRAEAWRATGPMDDSIGRAYAEDLDWGIRCWKAGYRILAQRNVWFLHEMGGTFSKLQAEGKFGETEGTEAAERCQVKYPFLWREPPALTLARCRAWYLDKRS